MSYELRPPAEASAQAGITSYGISGFYPSLPDPLYFRRGGTDAENLGNCSPLHFGEGQGVRVLVMQFLYFFPFADKLVFIAVNKYFSRAKALIVV